MNCPAFQHHECDVIDSRSTVENSIRRRRQCRQCQHRWTTYELTEEAMKARETTSLSGARITRLHRRLQAAQAALQDAQAALQDAAALATDTADARYRLGPITEEDHTPA